MKQPVNAQADPGVEQALKVLKQVMDPELFVNIIDLGLVYGIDFSEPGKITVTMTLSTPHCPLGEAIKNGVCNVLSAAFPNRVAEVTIVWEPAWSVEMLTEEGRRQLNFS